MITNPYRYPAGGGGEFDFSTLGTVYVWIDFSRVDTLFDATSGGSNVTDGVSIKRAEDLSGNDYHYTDNSTKAPPWKESAINGIGAADCNGTNHTLLGGGPPDLSGDFTQIIVFNRASDGINSASTGESLYNYTWFTDDVVYWARWASSHATGPDLTGTTGDFIATISRDGSDSSNLYHNGALIDGPNTKSGTLKLNSLFKGAGYHSGYFAFMIVYDGILSAADQDTAESELAAKFGITL